jgi:hypothetical protein
VNCFRKNTINKISLLEYIACTGSIINRIIVGRGDPAPLRQVEFLIAIKKLKERIPLEPPGRTKGVRIFYFAICEPFQKIGKAPVVGNFIIHSSSNTIWTLANRNIVTKSGNRYLNTLQDNSTCPATTIAHSGHAIFNIVGTEKR